MYRICIIWVLLFLVADANARILRWQPSKMGSTTFEILNTKASNTFLHETNWRLVDPLTGAVSNVSAVPTTYDTLQIYGASLILSVNFDMTFLQHIVLDFGEPRRGVTFSLRVKRDCEWLLHTTASILVRSGDLIADIDQTDCINTGIRIGGEFKLMADNCVEAVVRPFTFASSVTPVTVSIRQEGFISGTLPAVLDDFRALEKQDEVHLSWRTLQESNSSYFVVERSMDAKQFKALAQIPAAGQSSIEKTYSFIDRQAPKGILYYRLRTLSVDESEVVSAIRSVRFSPAFHAMRVFPNPVQRQATLWVASNDSKPLRWQLFHSGGQLIASRQITAHSGNIELDFGDIKNGYYFLIIHREDGSLLRAGITVAH